MIETNMNRISTFRVSNSFIYALAVLPLYEISNFVRVETLILNNMKSERLESLLSQMAALSLLTALVITTVDDVLHKNEIYRRIFRLPALKYCKLTVQGLYTAGLSPIAIDECSSMEHLHLQLDCFKFDTFEKII